MRALANKSTSRTVLAVGLLCLGILLSTGGCSAGSTPGAAEPPSAVTTPSSQSEEFVQAPPTTSPTAAPTADPGPTAAPTPRPAATATPEPEPTPAPVAEFSYAVAKPRADDSQIPVFDQPGGPNRTLLDANAIDGTRELNPLYAQTWFGNPLVLRLLEDDSENGWLLVQVPTRPNHSHAWVRADDFDIGTTNVSVEATTATTIDGPAGRVWVYRDDQMIFTAPTVSGRDTRPTPLVTGWVGQSIAGPSLSHAYGSWIVDLGTFSEALGSFGGGTPLMVFHGTDQPNLIGQRVSSGAFRLTNEDISELAAIDGLLGAPVHIHSGEQLTTVADHLRPTRPAETTNWTPDAPPLIPTPL